MRYVRTTDGRIIKFGEPTDDGYDKGTMEIQNKPQIVLTLSPFEVLKESHSIEELCDEWVIKYKNEEKTRCIDMDELLEACKNIGLAFVEHIKWLFDNYKGQLEICRLAIWTDKGLIYVAKMNEKGELEVL